MKLYIQSNKRQEIAAKIAASSFVKNGFDKKDIFFIEFEKFNILKKKIGKNYLRAGKIKSFKDDLQSFTFLRFAAPKINGFKDKILVIDPDVFALKNTEFLEDLIKADDEICCTFINGKARSEIMFIDASKVKWDFEEIIEKIFNLELDYKDLINLQFEENRKIKKIDLNTFNSHDKIFKDTILLHTSKRETQPWKEGLKIDFSYDHSFKVSLFKIVKNFFNQIRNLNFSKNIFYQTYNRHPSEEVREMLRNLYLYALENNFIQKNDVDEAVENKFISSKFIKY